MTPYFQRDGIQLFHGDCREIIPQLPALPGADLVLADPPYGINYQSTHNSGWHKPNSYSKWMRKMNFPGIVGDDQTRDPGHVLVGRKHCIFGGQYFAPFLPQARCWIVWDKNDGKTPSNQADCELAWTDFDRVSRVFRHSLARDDAGGRGEYLQRSETPPASKAGRAVGGRSMPGEQNPRAVLTKNQVEAIRLDSRTQRTIAAEYGISKSQVGNIKSNKQWVRRPEGVREFPA